MTMMMMMIIIIDLKEKVTKIWKLNAVYTVSVLSTTCIITNKLHSSSKILNLRPWLSILAQKAVALNTYRIVRKFWQNSE